MIHKSDCSMAKQHKVHSANLHNQELRSAVLSDLSLSMTYHMYINGSDIKPLVHIDQLDSGPLHFHHC